MVPQSAVRDDNGQKFVFLVKDDHVERRAVNVGTTVARKRRSWRDSRPETQSSLGGQAI